jgi:hypothetical protein
MLRVDRKFILRGRIAICVLGGTASKFQHCRTLASKASQFCTAFGATLKGSPPDISSPSRASHDLSTQVMARAKAPKLSDEANGFREQAQLRQH